MTGSCTRCGADLLSLHGVALVLADDAARLTEAVAALDSMRLALPSAVPAALRGTAARWPGLAASLRCNAGACEVHP